MSIHRGHRQIPAGNYLKSSAELLVSKATAYSLWFDDWWDYRNLTGGARSKGINWFGYFTPDQKTDPVCKAITDQGRRILDALRFSNRVRRRKDSGVFEVCGPALRVILHWMFMNDIRLFSEFTPDQVSWFVEDVVNEQKEEFVRNLSASDNEDPVQEAQGISTSVLNNYLTVLVDVYNLGSEFTDFPELVMPMHPLRGASPNEIATEFGVVTNGWIPPVPDEVLHPLLEAANRWMDTYSDDILYAQDVYFAALKGVEETNRPDMQRSVAKSLTEIIFNGRGDLSKPWRSPLGQAANSPGSIVELRELHGDLRNASTSALQAGTGIRVSELAGIKVDGRDENGWPSCLEVRQSTSGLYDLYFLKGRVFKGSSDPEGTPAEWLLGVKPLGANSIPFTVKAILVLDALFRPWRERFGSNALIVSLGVSRAFPTSIPANYEIRSDNIRHGQNRFLEKHVQLPESYRAWRLSTHQLRKSFAQDIVRIDGTLIPAVRDHFKHTSDFVVESAYLGTDPRLLGLVNDVATREAARMIVGVLYEGQPLAGKMAEQIKSRKKHFTEVCAGARTLEGRINLLAIALNLDEVRFFTSEHADCFFRAHLAACHRDFLGKFDPNAKRPLNAYRTPENCGDCPNGVKSKIHLPYWNERLREYKEIEAANREANEHRIAAFAAVRVRQAIRVIRQLEEAAA
ncbi:hypothetical protein ACK9YZ_05405 [Rhizobium sp. ZK1]|uniref:hypothetical protein n=1 Tax=Rhizobium sp. ZK1 TaxID=3389872 RepID=UPI0039F65AC9